MSTAVFTGSFDPFTIGHKSIVDRALPMFDRIIIAIGTNTSKAPWLPLEERVEAIRRIYAGEPRVEVATFPGLAVEFARSCGARVLLRGVRSVADFEYERNMADANRLVQLAAGTNISTAQSVEIETVFLPALPELAVVSSSLVRELARFNAPYRHLLP